MRSFIAIELSEEIRGELAQAQAHLRYAGADVNWVKRQNMHLTLKFLGEVPEARTPDLVAALDRSCRAVKCFTIALDEIGVFPSADFPKVVWAGIRQGKDDAAALASHIESEFVDLGFARESRAFVAHLTIGRVRSGKNKAALREKLSTIEIDPIRQMVGAVSIYESTLTPSGPVYRAIHAAPLAT